MINAASSPREERLHGVVLNGIESCAASRPLQARLSFSDSPLIFDRHPSWEHCESGARFSSRVALHRHPQGWVLDIDCEGKGSFLLREDDIVVHWRSGTDASHYLQSIGLAVFLELKGVLCLHANALARDARAVGLIAPSRTGKSTLSLAMAAAGWHMLSDDMAALHRQPLDWVVYPSREQTRLWPDVGEFFAGPTYASCERVHARFDKRIVALPALSDAVNPMPTPLQTLYLLDRADDPTQPIEITPLSAAETVLVLLSNSIIGDAAAALGIEQRRLAAVSELASRVEVKRIIYPSGFDHLMRVVEAIEKDRRT